MTKENAEEKNSEVSKDETLEQASHAKEASEDLDGSTVETIKNTRIRKLLNPPLYNRMKALGYSDYHISKAFGIDQRSLLTFKKTNRYELLVLQAGDTYIADRLSLLANRLCDSITDEDIAKANLAQKITGLGILIDKSRLLRGQSTANISIQGQIIEAAEQTRAERYKKRVAALTAQTDQEQGT